jgi:hypothetical protein
MVCMPKGQKPSPFAMEVEIIITWGRDLRNMCLRNDAIGAAVYISLHI